jgi:uncharacterized lipoprotein YddW (UPF0748 family)
MTSTDAPIACPRGTRRSKAPALVFGLLFLAFGLAVAAQSQGGPGAIDDCLYADGAAAQAVWKPMGETAPASAAVVDGHRVLRLACNFAGTKIERASWDRAVKLDLGPARGVQFRIRCLEASPVSYFSLYFQSGEGWYHATFYPESSTDWNTVTIDKAEAGLEGKPAGWGQIKTIRISAWRGQDVNTEFWLSDIRPIGLLGADASVAILRAESAARRSPEEKSSIEQFTEAVARHFQALDIGCAVLSDLDVSAERLKKAKLVVLPHNPSMPDQAADALIQYLEGGGKLLAFYVVPERLYPVLGIASARHVKAPYAGCFSAIRFKDGALPGAPQLVSQESWNINAVQPSSGQGRILGEWLDDKGRTTGYPAVVATANCLVMTHVLLPDDAANKRRLLLATAGLLAPELWRQAADAQIARVGAVAGFSSLDQAAAQIARLNPQRTQVATALADAARLRQSARDLAARQEFAKAIDTADTAAQRVTEALCLAQQPLAGEFRAFWCHSAFGVQGLDWDQAIERLARNGFTAILPNMLWGGAAFYPSRVLPVASPVASRGDQVAQCLAACRKHGLQMHLWKVNWNLGAAAPREFVERMRREGRLQADSQGREQLWLCPSHPENRRLEVESLVEVARNYDIDGIHFDYIRYPDADHCYCAGCKARFELSIGAAVRNWPKDVLAEGPLRQQWLEWRRGNITALVKAVSREARAARPGIKLSAAVFPNWPADRDSIGQDWKLWCEKGYLDFVCPMDYTPSDRGFDNMIARQVQWAGRTPCYPGIGLSASTSHFGVERLIEQINLTRRHNTHGFVIFNYGAPECKEVLPLLGLGITAQSQVPSNRPDSKTLK